MKYIVEIYCDACYNSDPDGCFEGHSVWIANDGHNIESKHLAKRYDTKELAECAGKAHIKDCGPWQYIVHEIEL